jgi:protein SCO1
MPAICNAGTAAGALRRRVAAVAIMGVCALLSACDRGPGFRNTDITGSGIAKDGFALTDHTGASRTLQDWQGKVVVLFFGFTHCPDICPTSLVELAEVMKLLGSRADRVQVLFITVDPERDTPELLAKYVPAFDKRFIGLWGDPAATAKVARDFKVFYQKGPVSASGSYSVDHTAGSYVFDPQGRIRLFARHGKGPADLAEDIGTLLRN